MLPRPSTAPERAATAAGTFLVAATPRRGSSGMATTADSQFAQFCRTRAPALLADVFDRTAPELFRVAAHLCRGDRSSAEDALQATFLLAIERADDWDAHRPLLPWLLGVLVHHVHKQRR